MSEVQTTTSTDTSSPPTSDTNSDSQTTATTTSSSVFDSEPTTASSSSTNNDGSTPTSVTSNSSPEGPTSTDTTVETPTSVSNSSPDGPPTSAFSDTTSVETSTSTDVTTTTSTDITTTTSTDITTTTSTDVTSQSTTDPTSAESQTTTLDDPGTSATTVVGTTSETSTAVTTTDDTTTAPTSTTTVTDTTSETPTTLTESTGVTSTDGTTIVTDTTSQTSVSEPTTTDGTPIVTDTVSQTSVSEPTTTDGTPIVTDTASQTSVSETTIASTDGLPTDTGTSSSTETITVPQSQTVTQTEAETETRTTDATTRATLGTVSVSLTDSSTLASTGTSVSLTRITGSSTLANTDTLTDINTSHLEIHAQNTVPTSQPLILASTEMTTYTSTYFATSTLPDGRITISPTLTRTVTGTKTPPSTLQPNEFERNKATFVGVIVVATVLMVSGTLVGIWLCRRRRGRLTANSTMFWDVNTGRVLIPGHPASAGDRSLNSQDWRAPLAGEIGDDEEARENFMRHSGGSSILPLSYRDRPTTPPLDSVEAVSLRSTRLYFDGAQQRDVGSRFSDSSLEEGGVRTASLISISAEPTQIASRFSCSSSTSEPSSRTTGVISPFADPSSPARNSYWMGGTTRTSTPQSSLSTESTVPKRSESMGSRNVTSSERGWNEIEIEDIPVSPGRTSVSVIMPAVNPFETENTPSLMSQLSLLNPPTRPQFHTTLTDLIHRSRPPTLPPIPAVASPALTDDSFHPEGLLAVSESNGSGSASRTSLLDHVDYSRPIVERSSPFDDGDITFRMSGATESSADEGGKGVDSCENPFRDPEDLLNDVSPVLTMLRRVGTKS